MVEIFGISFVLILNTIYKILGCFRKVRLKIIMVFIWWERSKYVLMLLWGGYTRVGMSMIGRICLNRCRLKWLKEVNGVMLIISYICRIWSTHKKFAKIQKNKTNHYKSTSNHVSSNANNQPTVKKNLNWTPNSSNPKIPPQCKNFNLNH
jgi:hypothetical protein